MAQSLGYAFAPTFDNAELGKRGGSPAMRQQDAIQVLNFRLPRIVGSASANALSPLVGDERRGVDFGGAVLQSVLRTILGADADAVMSGSSAASAVGQQGRDPGQGILSALSQQQQGGSTDGAPNFGGPAPSTPNPVIRPGQEAPDGQEAGAPMPDYTTGPAPTGGGLLPPLAPDYQRWSALHPDEESAWKPEPYQAGVPDFMDMGTGGGPDYQY